MDLLALANQLLAQGHALSNSAKGGALLGLLVYIAADAAVKGLILHRKDATWQHAPNFLNKYAGSFLGFVVLAVAGQLRPELDVLFWGAFLPYFGKEFSDLKADVAGSEVSPVEEPASGAKEVPN